MMIQGHTIYLQRNSTLIAIKIPLGDEVADRFNDLLQQNSLGKTSLGMGCVLAKMLKHHLIP